MKPLLTYALALIAGIAFLYLVKLMDNMSQQMTLMTTQITQIASQMQQMAVDVHGMRQGVDNMSTVIQHGSRQMQQMNPMDMIKGSMPGTP